MSTANENSLTISPATQITASVDFNREQVDLLKSTICKGATDNELKLFMAVCKSKNMDPFSKQIYAIKRWDPEAQREVMTFQVGIDGFRAKADSTGLYEGQLPPQWCGADGVWKDVWLSPEPPRAAKATVLRKGFREPMTAIALYHEYVQTQKDKVTPNAVWRKSPANQLQKCAESLAFRKAFPEQLGGLYTEDEMGPADNADRNSPGTGTVAQEMRQQPKEEPKRTPPPTTGQGTSVQQPTAQAQPGVDPDVDPELAGIFSRMTTKGTMTAELEKLHDRAIAVLGKDAGESSFRQILGKFGVQSANEFKTRNPAVQCAKVLFEGIKAVEADLAATQPASDAPVVSDEWGEVVA